MILGKHFDKENTLPLQNEKNLVIHMKTIIGTRKDDAHTTTILPL